MNGATGVVTRIEYGPYPESCKYPGHPERTIIGVHIRLDSSGFNIRVGRSKTAYFYDTGSTRYKKSTFPLAPAYAMTGRRSLCCSAVRRHVLHTIVPPM